MEIHYRHFNAATLVDAAREYRRQLALGNRMMITLAGAMRTAEIGISLAEPRPGLRGKDSDWVGLHRKLC
jgi:deoxyhypusine synthase